jgi:hypothetical protein
MKVQPAHPSGWFSCRLGKTVVAPTQSGNTLKPLTSFRLSKVGKKEAGRKHSLENRSDTKLAWAFEQYIQRGKTGKRIFLYLVIFLPGAVPAGIRASRR